MTFIGQLSDSLGTGKYVAMLIECGGRCFKAAVEAHGAFSSRIGLSTKRSVEGIVEVVVISRQGMKLVTNFDDLFSKLTLAIHI